MNDVSDAARRISALGASKGGRARAASLTAEERSRIARGAAQARWMKNKPPRTARARREYAVVAPEVKEWMDAEPRVGIMLAALCARADRSDVLNEIEKWLKTGEPR